MSSRKTDQPRTPNETSWQESKGYTAVANDNPQDTVAAESVVDYNRFYWAHIIPTFIVVFCPWIFFAAVKLQGGVQFSHHASEWIYDHPKENTFIFTGISVTFNSIIGLLFANSATNLAKKWIAHKGTDVFGLSFFTSLKKLSLPWQWKCMGLLITRYLFWVVLLYVIVFHFVSASSISALITPGPFIKHSTLQGQELDFAASSAECATWFQDNAVNNSCDWGTSKGGQFTTCLVESQVLDVLESGRNNIVFLTQNTPIGVTVNQLGVQFLGPLRGVLPNGPNGIPQFDTLSPSSSFNASADTDLTYNYTLQLQGLSSDVSCAYTPDTPVKYGSTSVGPYTLWTYNGTCADGQDVLDVPYFLAPPILAFNNGALGSWACGSGDSYTVYLAGAYGYNSSVGNISCSVSAVQPAVFPVEYVGRTGIFSTKPHTSTSAGTSSELIIPAIKSLGAVIEETQNLQYNAFAESVLTLGVQSSGQSDVNQTDTNLRLFEAMIEGILDYEATYIRLLYSANPTPPPSSCLRTIDGSVDYQVIGWFVNSQSAFFLIPLTILNLTSLLMLVGTMLIGEKKLFEFDPTLQENFIFDSGKYVQLDPSEPDNWPTKIEHGPTVVGRDGLRLKQDQPIVADDII